VAILKEKLANTQRELASKLEQLSQS